MYVELMFCCSDFGFFSTELVFVGVNFLVTLMFTVYLLNNFGRLDELCDILL